jgi:hypothetical protein
LRSAQISAGAHMACARSRRQSLKKVKKGLSPKYLRDPSLSTRETGLAMWGAGSP